MAAGEGVPATVVERPGELEAHAHELRPVDEHGAKGRDGFVQQRFAGLPLNAGPAGRLDRGEAEEEAHVGPVRRAVREGPEQGERRLGPARLDQRPRLVDPVGR